VTVGAAPFLLHSYNIPSNDTCMIYLRSINVRFSISRFLLHMADLSKSNYYCFNLELDNQVISQYCDVIKLAYGNWGALYWGNAFIEKCIPLKNVTQKLEIKLTHLVLNSQFYFYTDQTVYYSFTYNRCGFLPSSIEINPYYFCDDQPLKRAILQTPSIPTIQNWVLNNHYVTDGKINTWRNGCTSVSAGSCTYNYSSQSETPTWGDAYTSLGEIN